MTAQHPPVKVNRLCTLCTGPHPFTVAEHFCTPMLDADLECGDVCDAHALILWGLASQSRGLALLKRERTADRNTCEHGLTFDYTLL